MHPAHQGASRRGGSSDGCGARWGLCSSGKLSPHPRPLCKAARVLRWLQPRERSRLDRKEQNHPAGQGEWGLEQRGRQQLRGQCRLPLPSVERTHVCVCSGTTSSGRGLASFSQNALARRYPWNLRGPSSKQLMDASTHALCSRAAKRAPGFVSIPAALGHLNTFL